LLVRTEPADFFHNGGEKFAGSEGAMATQGFNQALFAELFAMRAESFGDAICIQSESVPGKELAFLDVAFPLLKSAENCRCGAEPIERIIGTQ
jgi:hypothetical protein